MATVAAGILYSNRECLFRLQTLIIDGGTEVLRNLFDQRLSGVALDAFLANEKKTIKFLKQQKTITKAQYNLLYPPSGQPPNSADFDITLIICLLRNLPSLGIDQNYAWNVPPQSTDVSVEADLCRLKGFRNEIAHISSTKGFQESSFEIKWSEIEQVFLRLNKAVTNPLADFNQTIDNYKYNQLEPATEQRVKTVIEQWRQMERGLDIEMQLLKEDVSDTKQDVKSIKEDVTTTNKHVEVIKQQVDVIEKDLKTIKQGMSVQEETEKAAYVKLKSDLQDDLISFYRRQHKRITLSPLLEEDQPLLKFFEMPDIQAVKVTRTRDGYKEERTPVRTLRDVFYKENKLCNNIYLTADAGYGKTALSKRLTLAWCHAKRPEESEDKHFSEDEITDMRRFAFVFLVLLRDSSSECDIDMLILNQVFSQISRDFTSENLKHILHNETCLVILDGLDEWTHPACKQGQSDIPHQRTRENVAVLTTTRPWKLSVSGLHASQIDKKLELIGLNDNSAEKLKLSVISHLYEEQDENTLRAYEEEFNNTVQEKHKWELTTVPLFLLYFLFLWYFKFSVGKTLADLYSSITELLLSRTVQRDQIPKAKNFHGKIPSCFIKNPLCKQFYTLLTTLGELAFQTLFNETKENTLVFDGCIAETYLKDNLTFCLKTGIITQSKVRGTSLLEQKTKVSFAHKTVQEFLAALYMNSAPDQSSVQAVVESKCKCVRDILDMSKILLFLVGINANSLFSRELLKIINKDEVTQEYRSLLQSKVNYHPLKLLQDLYISCCQEFSCEDEAILCLQDVLIEWSCKLGEYRENLKQLTSRNKQDIRSLYINMFHMDSTPYNTAQKVIDYFNLYNLENIEKIYYRGKCIDDNILTLLNSSVKSLSLSYEGLLPPGLWSPLFERVKSLQKLEAIEICEFEMSHSELSLLFDYVSEKNCMREIKLGELSCTDHKDSCTGLRVNLSGHLSLRKVILGLLNLSEVIVNMASLDKCCIQYISNTDLELKFLNCKDSKLSTFICRKLNSSAAIDVVLNALPLLHHVRQVELGRINLGARTLSLDFKNIKCFELGWMTMEALTFSGLIDSVLKLQQTVIVDIFNCTISPRGELEKVIENIKTLQHVRVIEDWKEIKGRVCGTIVSHGD